MVLAFPARFFEKNDQKSDNGLKIALSETILRVGLTKALTMHRLLA